MAHRTSSLSPGMWLLSAVLLAGVAVVRDPVPDRVASAAATRPTERTTTTAPPTTATTAVLAPTTVPPTTVPPTTATVPPTPAPVPPAPPAPRPAPVPTTTPAPSPAPVAPPAPNPAEADPAAYASGLLREVVPARWLAAVPAYVTVISGKTSWAHYGGRIEVGDWHLFSSVARARFTLAHEWGHLAAWAYGPDTYDGEPPHGFPYRGPGPEEQWGDCVAEVLTGSSYPSGGHGGCPSDARSFTASWLAAGPPR